MIITQHKALSVLRKYISFLGKLRFISEVVHNTANRFELHGDPMEALKDSGRRLVLSVSDADTPVLANIYLHYVLDMWFEKRFASMSAWPPY